MNKGLMEGVEFEAMDWLLTTFCRIWGTLAAFVQIDCLLAGR